jgi:hypothetical protein
VQVEYVARTLLAPIIDRRALVVEVKATAEDQWVNSIHNQLSGSVFAAGCSNWYINEFGRNAASWPGFASTFWKETLKARPDVFNTSGGSRFWATNMLKRWLRTTSASSYLILFTLLSVSVLRRNSIAEQRLSSMMRVAIARIRGIFTML